MTSDAFLANLIDALIYSAQNDAQQCWGSVSEKTRAARFALDAHLAALGRDPGGRGRGDGAGEQSPYVWLLRGQGDDGPTSVSYLDPDGWTDNLAEVTGYLLRITADGVAAEAKLEGITVEVVHRDTAQADERRRLDAEPRARLGAAPAPDAEGGR